MRLALALHQVLSHVVHVVSPCSVDTRFHPECRCYSHGGSVTRLHTATQNGFWVRLSYKVPCYSVFPPLLVTASRYRLSPPPEDTACRIRLSPPPVTTTYLRHVSRRCAKTSCLEFAARRLFSMETRRSPRRVSTAPFYLLLPTLVVAYCLHGLSPPCDAAV